MFSKLFRQTTLTAIIKHQEVKNFTFNSDSLDSLHEMRFNLRDWTKHSKTRKNPMFNLILRG